MENYKDTVNKLINLFKSDDKANHQIAKLLYVSNIHENKEASLYFWDNFFNGTEYYYKHGYLEIFNLFGSYCIEPYKQYYPDEVIPILNEKYKWFLIGVDKWHHISGEDHGYKNLTNYGLLLYGYDVKLVRERVMITFADNFGSCGSGYCAASWGNHVIKSNIHYDYNTHYKVKEPLEVSFVNINDWNLITSNDGILIYEDGDGGDSYYPMGSVYQNLDEYIYPAYPERIVDKPNVYFLSGDSGLGKSYLGKLLDEKMSVFETDKYVDEDYFPYMINHNLIIVGNKNKSKDINYFVNLFKQQLAVENCEANIIVCDLKMV